MTDQPTDISEFHCVDEHRRIEEDDGRILHHVVFYKNLPLLYGRLLDIIRQCGYEPRAFGLNREPDPDWDDDVIEDFTPTMQPANGVLDDRLYVVFEEVADVDDITESETELTHRDWLNEDPPEWVTDLPL